MPEKLPEIYRTLGTDYAERVLPSIIQETLKSVIAQYNASQLLTMREVRMTKAGCISGAAEGSMDCVQWTWGNGVRQRGKEE